MSDHLERGDRVMVCDGVTPDPGTVTGWRSNKYGGTDVFVDLDNGNTWVGLPDWLEALP